MRKLNWIIYHLNIPQHIITHSKQEYSMYKGHKTIDDIGRRGNLNAQRPPLGMIKLAHNGRMAYNDNVSHIVYNTKSGISQSSSSIVKDIKVYLKKKHINVPNELFEMINRRIAHDMEALIPRQVAAVYDIPAAIVDFMRRPDFKDCVIFAAIAWPRLRPMLGQIADIVSGAMFIINDNSSRLEYETWLTNRMKTNKVHSGNMFTNTVPGGMFGSLGVSTNGAVDGPNSNASWYNALNVMPRLKEPLHIAFNNYR